MKLSQLIVRLFKRKPKRDLDYLRKLMKVASTTISKVS